MTSIFKIRQARNAFVKATDTSMLGKLLEVEPHKISLLSVQPQYKVYKIPKKNKQWRLIEDPDDELKDLLKKLNFHLQAAYYYIRPDAVHGFCISDNQEEDRNIISNARRHIGQHFMLNIDLRDFFHTIIRPKVYQIFETHFPKADRSLLKTLTDLCCYRNRLPMGSPTSPVLSNYAALELDHELIGFTDICGITYSRFADDLTFSSKEEIHPRDQKTIREIISRHFIIHPEKDRYYAADDIKQVTGIIIKENDIALPEKYLDQVSIEIERLRQTMQVEARYRTGMSMKKLALFEQELRGKLNFAAMVMPDNESIDHLQEAVTAALNPLEDFESADWLDMPYTFF